MQSQNTFLKIWNENKKIQLFGVIMNLFQVYDGPLQMLNEDVK